MFCPKCKLTQGILNSGDGMRHLRKMKAENRLPWIDIGRFGLLVGDDRLKQFVLNQKRKETVLVRTSAPAGKDAGREQREIQPECKFAPLNDNGEGVKDRLETFFKEKLAYEARYDKKPRSVYQVLTLPDAYYREIVEVTMMHRKELASDHSGVRVYTIMSALPDNCPTSKDVDCEPIPVFSGKITYSAEGNYLRNETKLLDNDRARAWFEKMKECYDAQEPMRRRISETTAEMIGEFDSGVSKLRIAVYEKNPVPVAFGWIVENWLSQS